MRECIERNTEVALLMTSSAVTQPAGTLDQPAVAQSPAAAADCSCSEHGVFGKVITGQPGCARHGHEGGAGTEPYCFIGTGGQGGSTCAGAIPSAEFPGLFLKSCVEPAFRRELPAGCELVRSNVEPNPPLPPELVLNNETGLDLAPPEEIEDMRIDVPYPTAVAEPVHVVDYAAWGTTLSPAWMEQHGSTFLRGAGLPVPAAPAPAPMDGYPMPNFGETSAPAAVEQPMPYVAPPAPVAPSAPVVAAAASPFSMISRQSPISRHESPDFSGSFLRTFADRR